MLWYKYLILICLVFLFPALVSAEIVINEIYPAPKDGDFEWIELYNPDEVSISTDQYILKDLTGKSLTFNSPSIEPHSYVLATSSALLNNKDESVFLTKKSGEIIQTITYSIQFDSDKSYNSCPELSSPWQVSSPTKASANSCPTPTLFPSPPSSTTAPEPTGALPTPPSFASTYSGILINEVMAAPNTGEKEWIELYNSNNFPVSLTDWYIDTHKFSISIPANGYAVLDRSSATFTNAGDTIQLLDASKVVKDTFSYTSTEKNMTLGRESVDSNTFCLQQPSKGLQNTACTSPQSSSSTLATSKANSSKTASNKSTSSGSSSSSKKTVHLYEGVIVQALPSESSEPVEEKEYTVSGYKTAAHPVFQFLKAYGFYSAIGLSLLAFAMILVKMRRYLYEKDSLLALAVVATICLNGCYIHSLFTVQYSSV